MDPWLQAAIDCGVIAAGIGKIHMPIGGQVGAVVVHDKQAARIGQDWDMQARLRITVPRIGVIGDFAEDPHAADLHMLAQRGMNFGEVGVGEVGNEFTEQRLVNGFFEGLLLITLIRTHVIQP